MIAIESNKRMFNEAITYICSYGYDIYSLRKQQPREKKTHDNTTTTQMKNSPSNRIAIQDIRKWQRESRNKQTNILL